MATSSIKVKKKRLLSILKKLSYKKGRVVLSSGKISNYYFDGRITSLSSEGSYHIASIILDMLKKEKVDAIGLRVGSRIIKLSAQILRGPVTIKIGNTKLFILKKLKF